MHKIGFIGAGNMAFALAKAIGEKKISNKIIASDISSKRLNLFKIKLNAITTKNNVEVVKKSDIIFLAVKPQIMDKIIGEIKHDVKDKLIISIAAGIKLSTLQKRLNKVVRVMPNTPCLVGEMAAGFSVVKKVTASETKVVKRILSSAGMALQLKEAQLDAVTALSGSGPAFISRLIEAFIEAGVKQGLSKETSKKLAVQTFKGTSILLEDISTIDLVDMVSSPNGTTMAGRMVLEKSNYKDIIKKTISAAAKRSRELGK